MNKKVDYNTCVPVSTFYFPALSLFVWFGKIISFVASVVWKRKVESREGVKYVLVD